jgi:hypothetical protein
MSDFGYRVFTDKDVILNNDTPKKKPNPMFESMMKERYPVISHTYSKQDMEMLYNSVVWECMKITRKHTLEKFGIPDDFAGTTQIEKVIAEHFEVKHEVSI